MVALRWMVVALVMSGFGVDPACGDDVARALALEFRWFAAVFESGRLLCGASVIGKRFALTARHCVEGSEDSIFVDVGYHCLLRGNCGRMHQEIAVKDVHYLLSGGDIALLELDKPVKLKIPMAVPDLKGRHLKKLKRNASMTLVGGANTAEGELSHRVKHVDVNYIPQKKCKNKTPLATKGFICSVPKGLDAIETCAGDLGGPVTIRGKKSLCTKNRDVVLAVHSFGRKTCGSTSAKADGHYAVYTMTKVLISKVCKGDYDPEDWCGFANPKDGCGDDSSANQPGNEDRSKGALSVTGIPTTGTMIQKVPTGGFGFSASFDPTDANRLAGGGGMVLHILNRTQVEEENKGVVYQFPGVEGSILQTKYSRDGSMIATGGGIVYNVQIWDAVNLNGRSALYSLGPHTDNIFALVWSHDDKTLFVAGEESVVSHWDLATQTKIGTFRGHRQGSGIFGLDLHPDGTQLLTGSTDALIKIWNVETATELRSWNGGHRGSVPAVAYSPDGTKVVSGGNDGAVKVWDVAGEEEEPSTIFTFNRFLGGHTHIVNTVLFTPDGKYVVSGSFDQTIKFWDIENGGRPVLDLEYFDMNSVIDLEWIGQDGKNTLLLAALSKNDQASFVWEISFVVP